MPEEAQVEQFSRITSIIDAVIEHDPSPEQQPISAYMDEQDIRTAGLPLECLSLPGGTGTYLANPSCHLYVIREETELREVRQDLKNAGVEVVDIGYSNAIFYYRLRENPGVVIQIEYFVQDDGDFFYSISPQEPNEDTSSIINPTDLNSILTWHGLGSHGFEGYANGQQRQLFLDRVNALTENPATHYLCDS